MKVSRLIPLALVFLWNATSLHASSTLPLTTRELVQSSTAIFCGTVVDSSCFKHPNGLIYTRTSLRVKEPLKGTFPGIVQVVHRGGRVEMEDEFCGLSPRFRANGEYLLFVSRDAEGRLHCTQGQASAIPLTPAQAGLAGETRLNEVRKLTVNGPLAGGDVTDQVGSGNSASLAALTGMLDGIGARFLQPDRGEPIPYLIDADSLPAGITFTQATNAVRQALNAWTSVTSLKFQLEGIQSFGQGADTIAATDGKLRIQLHDNYNRINTPNVLGVGGRGASLATLPGVGWDIGGNVAGNEFYKTIRGYIVLESSHAAMQVLATFTEVLCHEVGHTLNLAHSSENPSEPDNLLKQAMMYFQAHLDGRGATLGTYDPPIIQQVYPSNTPPCSYSRVLDVTTAGNAPAIAGINEVELRGYDLQTTNLTLFVTNQTLINGVYSTVGNLVKYTPNDYFSDTSRLDPTGSSSRDTIYARFSDGTNASPYVTVRVLSYNEDSQFPTSDGLPDNWMNANFGHADPQSADKSRASDDADGDKLTNLQEYIAGTNPKDKTSAQVATIYQTNVIQWQAKAYELYEIQGVTNLTSTNWTRVGNPVLPTTATGSFSNYLNAVVPARFFRVLKVP